jgi:hypothetical protein
MASRTLKKNKRTKQRRSRTRRQRRRQMRGGDFLDYFKPTVETNDTCKEKYDKCLDKVSGKEDNNSFFKLPTFNLFGSSDTEKEKEDEGFEMQEYPVPAAPVVDVAAEQAAADAAAAEQASAAAAEQAAAAAAAEQAAAAAAEQAAADAAAAEQAAAIVPLPAAPVIDATADQTDLYSNNDATPSPAINADATSSQEDTSMGMVPQGNLSNPLLSTGVDAQAEAEENARKNNAMGMVPSPPVIESDLSMEHGGGSRKKYKRRHANRSKKNKNRRNNRRTNKKN